MRDRCSYGPQRDLGQKYCKVSCKNRFLDDCHYILYSDSFLFLCYYIQNKDIILDYSIPYWIIVNYIELYFREENYIYGEEEEMTGRNPYAISFGRIPNQYIRRDVLIYDILDMLMAEPVMEQAFKLTGIRGTGKTVTMTAIEKELRNNDGWIVIDLKSNAQITEDLVANLYSEVPFLAKYADANLNLSAFGIGVGLKKQSPVVSIDAALKALLKEVVRHGKRVLVAIDEVRKTDALLDFVQEFQILVREELPVFLLVAGLYEDIEDIENTDGLTFFLRAESYEMLPLNLDIIRENYKETLNLSKETATELAKLTKGYAFAYQAFGMYMWESHKDKITDLVLAQVDEALAQKVYLKIWGELKSTDKWYLGFIVKKESMSVDELLSITGKKHNEWSEPRKRLIEKGILDGRERGKISLKLPRFKEFVERMQSD